MSSEPWNTVVGSTWPSKPFTDRDFYRHDTARTIEITVLFEAALQCDAAVHGFRLSYKHVLSFEHDPEHGGRREVSFV